MWGNEIVWDEGVERDEKKHEEESREEERGTESWETMVKNIQDQALEDPMCCLVLK